MWEICSKLTIEASDIGVFDVNFEYICMLFQWGFFVDFENVNTRWNSLLP